MANQSHDNCSCCPSHGSTVQTFDELDFERGIWSAALDNNIDAVYKHIRKGNVNARDRTGYTGKKFWITSTLKNSKIEGQWRF